MADDTYPGIEIRVRTDRGEILNSRSDTLYYELMQMWIENGFTGNEWYPVGSTVLRSVLVEVRAVDVPAPPRAPDYPHELYGIDAAAADAVDAKLEAELADVDGQAAELAERCCVCGSADVGYHNYRDQPFCWSCANGDRPPGHRGCCCHAGFSGDHPCCIHPAVDGQAAELAEILRLPHELAGRTDAELAELERFMTAADRAELAELTWRLIRLEGHLAARAANAGHEPAPSTAGGSGATAPGSAQITEPGEPVLRARLGSGLARIARRARFRSGRLANLAGAIRPTVARRRRAAPASGVARR